MVSPGFYLVGNDPAIDFANTVDSPSGNPAGALECWRDVVAFLQALGAHGPQSAAASIVEAVKSGSRSDFEKVLAFRAALRNALATLEQDHVPGRADVQVINEMLKLDSGCAKLSATGGEWKLSRERTFNGPLRALIPIAYAAAELIAMGKDSAVRKCSSPTCLIYFRDPARRRRWCSMAICGNRAKVAAHARRQKEA